MKIRKLLAAITSVICLSIGICSSKTYAKIVEYEAGASNKVATEEETLIYRKSVKGKCEGIAQDYNKWDFIYALTAYDNGHIHIDIQCELGNILVCNKIGDFQFNDSMIAAVGESGYAGKSTFDNHKLSNSKYTTSFSEKDSAYIVYSSLFTHSGLEAASEILMSFDLYVKEPYLTTNQPMILFGEEIEIPFGKPPIDKDVKIKELEEKVSALELSLNTMQNSILKLDANGDGFVNAVDASIVLSIYAYNSTNQTPIKTISDYYNTLK